MNRIRAKGFIEGYQQFDIKDGKFNISYQYVGLSKPLSEPLSKVNRRPFISGSKRGDRLNINKPFVKDSQPAVTRARIYYDDSVLIQNARIDTLLKAIKEKHGDEIITNRREIIMTDAYGNVIDYKINILINSNEVYIYEIIEEDPYFEYLLAYLYDDYNHGLNPRLVIEKDIDEFDRPFIARIAWEIDRRNKNKQMLYYQEQLIAKSFIKALESRQDALIGNQMYENDPEIEKDVAKLLPELKTMVFDFLYKTDEPEEELNKKVKVDNEEGGICTII
jgi:hypothetical protein